MKIIIAITGASGATIGVKLAEALHNKKIETYVIISEGAKVVLKHETDNADEILAKLKKSATQLYDEKDLSAPIASGSFPADGMIVAPCSMKTLAAIAHGYSDNLITRAADVCIKQKRKLVIVPRETPFSSIHLENMLSLSNQEVWIIPAVFGLYFRPKSAEDIEYYLAGKVLEALGIEHNLYRRWQQ